MATAMHFEWDEAKAAINVAKHSLSFEEAVAAFADPLGADFDASHSADGEPRRKRVAQIEGRTFTVVYTLRGEVVRLISARRANAPEARRYER